MTMFDEATLANALRDAGDSLAVSDGAIERILDVAQTEPPRTRSMWRPSIAPQPSRRSVLFVALAAAVVLGIAVPLFCGRKFIACLEFCAKDWSWIRKYPGYWFRTFFARRRVDGVDHQRRVQRTSQRYRHRLHSDRVRFSVGRDQFAESRGGGDG